MLLLREKTIRERECVTREREAKINQLHDVIDDLIETYAPALREREDMTREREAEIGRLIKEQTQALCERDNIIIEREAEIVRLHRVINGLNAERDAKLDALHRREARLISQERRLQFRRVRDSSVPVDDLSETVETIGDFDADAELERWFQRAGDFQSINLRDAQKLTAPYVLERPLNGHVYRMIIGTEEGRRWYDNLETSEVHQSLSLGMISIGDTIFDCGCNQGFNALIYSDIVGRSGKVLAFDPYPLNIEISRFNASLNRKTNIEFIEVGFSEKEGEANVSISEQCTALNDPNAPDLTTIKLVPLDNYAAFKPSYVKIDIEGAEVDALAGASEIINQKPAMYIEVHPNFLPLFKRNPMDIFDFINLDDYFCFINYPGMPALSVYEMDFEIVEHCALFFVPRDRPPVIRYYPADRARPV